MTPSDKMTRARISLLLDEPFFGSLLLNLTPIQDNSVPTMATDGERLVWNADFANRLSERQLKTVLAHEALHPGLLHHIRRGDRDGQQWNIACDFAVNLILEQANDEARAAGRTVPFEWPTDPSPLLDKAHVGKSAEEIYQAPQPGGNGGGNKPGKPGAGNGQPQPGMGDVNDAPNAQDESQASEQEAKWKKALIDAATAAKGRGHLPASMRRLVDEIINPAPRWQEILRRFISDRAADDYSWTRPNPRYLQTGFILPSLYSQRLGTIGIIRDTSGSTQDWQEAILAELAGIIHETRPNKVIIIDADSAVQRVLELEPRDALPTDSCGGGGTDFRPALAKMEDYNPVCCVYLTDLDGAFTKQPPSYPIIWATNGDDKAPFGDTIKV